MTPSIESIESDEEHGSATLSIRALELLRDEAMRLASGESDYPSVEGVARRLVEARPTMTAVANRVRRAVVTAEERTPEAVAESADEAIFRAQAADEKAASAAAERIDGQRVATLSRSGTVLQTLQTGDPSAVLVAESRPGGEGVGVARDVSEVADVTLTSDAAFPGQLSTWDADSLLVGADSILADGRVVNKVGTFGAALAANHHDIEVVVAAASDKVDPGTSFDPEPRSGSELAKPEGVDSFNPTFEAVPQALVDRYATEDGTLGLSEIRETARRHAEWQSSLEPNDSD